MRPPSIVNFERLSLLSIFAGVAFVALTWGENEGAARAPGLGDVPLPAVQGFGLALLLLLIFLVSRKASAIAKWILVVLFALGVAFMVPGLTRTLGDGLVGLLLVTQIAVQAVAFYFLFTPEARAWFGGSGT